VDGLELGGLVDHVLRRGDLAAVVQPGCDVNRFPLGVVELEVPEGPVGLGAGRSREHLGQIRNACAVAPGVRALGVDGVRDDADEGFEQRLLRFDQFPCLERGRRGPAQGPHERQLSVTDWLAAQQQHRAHELLAAVQQRHGHTLTRAECSELGSRNQARQVAGGKGCRKRRAICQRSPQQRPGVTHRHSRKPVQQLPAVCGEGCSRGQLTFVGQVQYSCLGVRCLESFGQQLREQPFEILLGGDCGRDIQKTANRALHAVHGHGEFIDFLDPGAHARGLRKVEPPNRFGLVGERAQRTRNRPRGGPGDRNRQQHDQHGGERRGRTQRGRGRQQFPLRHRVDQEQGWHALEKHRIDAGAPTAVLEHGV
jgi:hypothetical protein